MIFDKIIDVTKIVLGEHDILAEAKRDSKSDIIIAGEKEGLAENTNEYAVIVAMGSAVDETKFALGNVILAGNGRNNKSFDYHKKKYIIFSSHSVGIMVTPDNFRPTKNASKAVQKSKS